MAWSEVATAILATSAQPGNGVTTFNLGSLAGGAVASGDKVTGKIVISDQSARTITSVTDDSGNTWTQDLSNNTVDGTYTNHYDVWSTVLSSATLPANVTAHFSGALGTAPGISCALGAYRGTLGSGGAADIDISLQATGTSGATYDSGTTVSTTTAANELKVGAGGDDGANSALSAGTSDGVYTLFARAQNSSFSQTLLEDRDSGASGSTARATVTSTLGAAGWSMSVVVYKLAAAGGAVVDTASAIVRGSARQVAPAAVRAGALFRQGSVDGPATVIQLVHGNTDLVHRAPWVAPRGRLVQLTPNDGPPTVITLVQGFTDFALHPAKQSRLGRVVNWLPPDAAIAAALPDQWTTFIRPAAPGRVGRVVRNDPSDGPATVIQLVEGASFVLRPAAIQKFGRVITSAADMVAVAVEQFDVVAHPMPARVHGRTFAGDAADAAVAVAPTTGWESDFTGRLPYRGPRGIRLMLTQTVPWDGDAPPPVVGAAPDIIYLPKINRFAIRLSDTLYEIL